MIQNSISVFRRCCFLTFREKNRHILSIFFCKKGIIRYRDVCYHDTRVKVQQQYFW